MLEDNFCLKMLHEELRLVLQLLEEKKSVQLNVGSTWKYELAFLTVPRYAVIVHLGVSH